MESRMYVATLVLGLAFVMALIKDTDAGIRTREGPSGSNAGEPRCTAGGTVDVASGETWTDSYGRRCTCFAHGRSNCDTPPGDDN